MMEYWRKPFVLLIILISVNLCKDVGGKQYIYFDPITRAFKVLDQTETNRLKRETKNTNLKNGANADNSVCNGENCIEHRPYFSTPRWTMPFIELGSKKYYIGHFFKANWYKAQQYCRFHGMNLASIESKQENILLEKYISEFGLGHEHFWTSGTDQGEEGFFIWLGNGRPVSYVNWNAGEPNNFRYENGEEEHCLELWNRDAKGLKWNDSPCTFEAYFICEVN